MFFRNPLSQAGERRTRHRQFSGLRVMVSRVVMVVAPGAVLGLGHLISANGWPIS